MSDVDNNPTTDLDDDLRLSRAGRIDRACDRFEADWRAGRSPRIEEYLTEAAPRDRAALLRELLALELELGRGPAPAGEYRARFPGFEGVVDALLVTEAGDAPGTAATAGSTLTGAGAFLPPDDTPPEIPGYEMRGELGRGGMGVVYLARHVRTNRLVALKMILAPGLAGAAQRLRFQIEGEALARLRHPNVVQVFDVGEHEGRPFFSLEYVDGGNLAGALKLGPPTPKQAAGLVETLAQAVHAAHQAGIVHRDLKPANILLAFPERTGREDTAQGVEGNSWVGAGITPKVTDFGLAKHVGDDSGLTQTGQILGTPCYMAPEQVKHGGNVGVPADVYALGAILYELLAGRPPFRAKTAWDTMMLAVNETPTPPSKLREGLPRDLETICLKCLEKDPGRRYPSADALADDLRRFRESRPVRARVTNSTERIWLWCRRRPAMAALAGALVAAVGLGFAGVATQWARAETNRTRAETNLARSQNNFDLAMGAIESYYNGINKDVMLKEPDLKELRASLLGPPLEFYRRLRVELTSEQGRADPRSARQLAEASAALARLTAELETPDKTVAAYVQALDAADAVVAARPQDLAARRLSAKLRVEVGEQYHALGRDDRARASLNTALDAFDKSLAVAATPHPLDVQGRASCLRVLGDLEFDADRLKPAGERYNAAVDALDRLSAARPDDFDVLDDLASARKKLAIFYAERRLPRAEPLFEAVLDAREKAYRLRPGVPTRFQLAAAYSNLGAYYNNGDRVGLAEAPMLSALKIREELIATRPTVTVYRSDLAVSHFNLATFYENTERLAEAESELLKALETQGRLVKDYPGIKLHEDRLFRTEKELGDVYLSLNDYDRAATAYEKLVDRRERDAAGGGASNGISVLATARRTLADLQNFTGRTFAARTSFLKSLDEFNRATRGGEGTFLPDVLWEQATCLRNTAGQLVSAGNPAGAKTPLDRALKILEKLEAGHKGMAKYTTAVGECHMTIGDMLAAEDRRVEAIGRFDRAEAAARTVLAKESQEHGSRSLLFNARSRRASALSRLGRFPEALIDWQLALETARPEDRRAIAFGQAATLARAGNEAAALARMAEASKLKDAPADTPLDTARVYALLAVRREALGDQAVDAVNDAISYRWVGDGVKLLHKLSDTDFDAIRPTPAFQAAVARLTIPPDPFSPAVVGE